MSSFALVAPNFINNCLKNWLEYNLSRNEFIRTHFKKYNRPMLDISYATKKEMMHMNQRMWVGWLPPQITRHIY
jgi:hypothetical protein